MYSKVDKEIDNQFKIISEICNNGIKSRVYKVLDISTNKHLAIKTVDSYLKDSKYSLLPENEILSYLKKKTSHKNILPSCGFKEEALFKNGLLGEKSVMYLASPYCPYGDLFTLVQKNSSNLRNLGIPLKIAKYILKQIIEGLIEVHRLGICHRDIKLDNVLISDDFVVKITDFGCSNNTYGEENNSKILLSCKGTETYMAPEVLKNSGINNNKQHYNGEKSDVFSLGVLLFCLILNEFPFRKAVGNDNKYKFIENKNMREFWKKFERKLDKFSDLQEFLAIQEILNKMFCHNPEERISLEELLKNEIFYTDNISFEDFKLFIVKTYGEME